VKQKNTNTLFDIDSQIMDFCRHIAGNYPIEACLASEDYTLSSPNPKPTIEVIVVINGYPPRLMSYARLIDGRNVFFFTVDKWVFETDVQKGFLGEALASLLIFPYNSLCNPKYLKQQEITLKKRLIGELLENLVVSYPELSYSIQIKPEYFMYEGIINRVKIFPPTVYGASYFLHTKVKKQKTTVLQGYQEALKILQSQQIIDFSGEYIKINPHFIETTKNSKVRFTNIIKNAPRTLFTSIFSAFPQMLNFLTKNQEATLKFQNPTLKKEPNFNRTFDDPKKYIFVPTAKGLVSLADAQDILGFAKTIIPKDYKIQVEEFGGVLNDVYLIRATNQKSEIKILVKRFKDLSSFKWFPLSMWSVGARSFALLGKPRLERECAINQLLANNGFAVPKILHVSTNERLVFMEFIEGENVSHTIKQIALSHNNQEIEKELETIGQVGETYAKVHALDVVLGDTKPENVMIDKKGKMYLIDFEQAGRKGDKAWDIACFLYYSGHYLPLNTEAKAELIAQAFITGYLKAGGNSTTIKSAALSKFTRVFSIFTLPGILRTLSNTCKKQDNKPQLRLNKSSKK
jgi:tRNA A-37 threonylcarbamoyl transferase component Bud32